MSSSKVTPNYYAVLGIPIGSTEQVINTAYKKLMLLHHPDKAGGDEVSMSRFHEVQEAAETLRDPQRRRIHDEALALYSKSKSRINIRRYSAADDRRNWFHETSSWSSSNRQYNFDDPHDRYVFTYGTGVHMDPDSETSRAEIARHEHDMEDWELTHIGVYPEIERKKREFRKAAMEARAARDEVEMQRAETLYPEGQPRSDEGSLGDEEMTIGEGSFTKGKGACEDYFEEKKDAWHYDVSFVEPDASPDSLAGATSTPTQLFPSLEDDCLVDLSHFEKPAEADNEAQMTENQRRTAINNWSLRVDEAACHNIYASGAFTLNGSTANLSANRDSDPLQPFLQFFSMKLERYTTRYTADDMYDEMQGLLLEVYATWLESGRLSLADPHSSKPKDVNGGCLHLGAWNQTAGIPECEKCHLWMPIFVLTCPGCGIKACIRCKFSGTN